MKEYSDCIEYLHSLGMPIKICRKICKSYENKKDFAGLLEYVLLFETMLESCVE